MQFTSIFTVLAVAMTAAALPSAGTVAPRVADNNYYSSETANTCCTGVANCVLQLVGETCSGSAYCCETDAPQVSFAFRAYLLAAFAARPVD
ncbi:uncharacterized protein THITE_2123482 [Thermothielavioides terrestris NRRL 8126]|uniref:Hydrophobin-like protein n=1 Tax=Thermothielavioides terrestris (strain ATCC 38088 / NRRL 8126) TaxID=578455 RepID=G2RHH5_THETT|nr:uncharacterized protein THITE_2123482 [Thermothielavioides terrestris NRRL 8126]AEO71287.1 hypothetical protein THITE_2123482 [Thermothielavioides terrestris NRRL 8126]